MVEPPDTAAIHETAADRSLKLGVEAAALAEFANSKEAEQLARLAADRDLVYELALHGYAGAPWRKFANALAEYGVQVVRAWISTERMFTQCKLRGLGLLPTDRQRTSEDVLELTLETVATSLAAFRKKVLIPGKWDPTRGATLKTFFIGQCVYQFPNVWRRWVRETAPTKLDMDGGEGMSPRSRIPTMIDLRREFAALPPDDVRHLQIMVEMGYSAAEIAEISGVSKRSVESRLFRHQRAQKAKP